MSTLITDTENTVDKSRSIPRTKWFGKSTMIEKPSEIDIHRDNLSVSIFSGQGESLSSVSPNILRIPCNNKGNKTPDTRSLGNKLLKNQSTQGKWQNKII